MGGLARYTSEVLARYTSFVGMAGRLILARYLPNGQLDPSFGALGK
jgi:hypothetical protein